MAGKVPMSKKGLLLLAHGAREPAWARPFEAVVLAIRAQQPNLAVRLAFLEYMNPNFDAATGSLAREGCTRLDVVPLFLGSGGHVQRDLPIAIDAMRKRHTNIEFRLHPPIGEAADVIQAMAMLALSASSSA